MKTKLRLQLMLGLLFIAMTISLIAVSFAWFSAEPAETKFEGSSVSVTTANNSYQIGTGFNLIGQVDLDNSVSLANPYRGEIGFGTEVYMLLFELTNPEAATEDLYVSSCSITIPSDATIDFNTKSDSEFGIKYVNYTDGMVSDADGITSYVVITFGNGESDFLYSDSIYMGTSFDLTITFIEEVE